ncbi:hypothetical protein AB0C59_19185 [Streptomyces sp. NPDC048664]|uniref:hypothetical protein n=1 Tax=Streptomyces sp. NPDC048664 TaxID=3154505 RepID=UPI00343913AF
MTQSGQGEEPSARPAREGIVLPSDGGEPLLPGRTGGVSGAAYPAGNHDTHSGTAPAGGQTWGQPWGPAQQDQAPPPPAQTWGGDTGQGWAPQQTPAPQQPQQPQQSWDSPDTHAGWSGAQGAGQGQGYGTGAQPLPPAADEGATQYIPPVTAGPDEGATQYLPPVPSGQGTPRYTPPAGPGALPPEAPADDATRYLGRAVGHGAAAPLPPASDPNAEATQYLPPVTGQSGPAPYGTPAEFDNLFRHDAAGHGSTQHLPRVEAPPRGPGRYDDGGHDDAGGRSRSKVPLIAAVGVGIVVLGIGAGALLSGGGGGGDDKSDASRNVSATAPAAKSSGPAAADPAQQQAVALDKLLADSGNSRGTVISAVADVKTCQNLGQAATDLRNAATQRGELVKRLAALSVDKLPDHDALTNALNSAWQASASADTHYAAWADQVAGNKKACHKGHARNTPQTAGGNRASGTASAQKARAAQLWNAIASKYNLTPRQPTQL